MNGASDIELRSVRGPRWWCLFATTANELGGPRLADHRALVRRGASLVSTKVKQSVRHNENADAVGRQGKETGRDEG